MINLTSPGNACLPVCLSVCLSEGWQRRGDAEAPDADFDSFNGGAKRHFEVGGVKFWVDYQNIVRESLRIRNPGAWVRVRMWQI